MAGLGWKWARGRGTKQLPLILCVVIAVIVAVMGRTHAFVFDSARGALSDWTAPALSALRGPLTALQNGIGGFANVFSVYSENAELRRENAELHKWQQVALSLEDRMRSYQQLLNAVPETRAPFITAARDWQIQPAIRQDHDPQCRISPARGQRSGGSE